MAYPEQLGAPCWTRDQAEYCINSVAQVTTETVASFLATHSPIKDIKDAKANDIVTEEEIFKALFTRRGEIRGVVRGDSGTGKSHLIRWVNLRAEYAAENNELGLEKFKIVMVRRDTGSLKSALQQIVEQLGGDFAQYIEDIKGALDKFSSETARRELVSALALEVGNKWESRGNSPLPRDLQNLDEILRSPGYLNWLCRDGGIIARKIARLTDSSSLEEREKQVVFSVSDVKPSSPILNKTRDAQQVYDFLDNLEYDDIDSDEVVAVLNQALIEAQRELTGIRGSKLHDIFIAIRKELHFQGKQLAVFVEDVTAASGGLDTDLFRAFEPHAVQGACRMIAVLGMTNAGWNPLPDNEKDRVDVEYDVGANAQKWSSDSVEVAKFAARYLNASRCSESELETLAEDRFESDIASSKCDDCPHKEECHRIFGFVELETGAQIGMYPFTPIAPQRMLTALNETRHRSSQRGLLDYVLDYALIKSYLYIEQQEFPNSKGIGVTAPHLAYWTGLESEFLGGVAWGTDEKKRAQFLVQFWYDGDSAEGAVVFLKQTGGVLGLPPISSEVTVDPRKGISKNKPVQTGKLAQSVAIPQPVPQLDPPEDKEQERLLMALDSWADGQDLKYDARFRDYVADLLKFSLRWQDFRGIPVQEAKKLNKTKDPIRIEGQRAHPSGHHYFIDLPRDSKTKGLLEALVRYNREGKKSWNFSHGELHKRRVSCWVRQNQSRLIDGVNPTPLSIKEKSIKTAAQFLALSAVLRRKDPLPQKDIQARISELFVQIWDHQSPPVFFNNKLGAMLTDIGKKWSDVKDFLISELGVGQGEAQPKDFIDPVPLLESLKNFDDVPKVDRVDDEASISYWKKRFAPVAGLSKAYDDLPELLNAEVVEIRSRCDEITALLVESGFDGRDLRSDFRQFMKSLLEVLEIEEQNLKCPPSPDFKSLHGNGRIVERKEAWATSLGRAEKVCNDKSPSGTLSFDSTVFDDAYRSVIIIKKHLQEIERELRNQETPSGSETSGTKEELLDNLKKIVSLQ